MLDWLKQILGDAYTEETDKKVSEQIGKDFVARQDFNALNEEKKTLNATIKARDAQIVELGKVDAAGLQAKIAELQAANTAAQAEYDTQVKKLRTDTLIEAKLAKEGAVNTKAVRALLNLDKISLDGENLVGLDDQLTALKTTEKWAFTPAAQGKSGQLQGKPAGAGDTKTVDSEIFGALFGSTE